MPSAIATDRLLATARNTGRGALRNWRQRTSHHGRRRTGGRLGGDDRRPRRRHEPPSWRIVSVGRRGIVSDVCDASEPHRLREAVDLRLGVPGPHARPGRPVRADPAQDRERPPTELVERLVRVPAREPERHDPGLRAAAASGPRRARSRSAARRGAVPGHAFDRASQSRPTYIASQPALRAIPITDGPWNAPASRVARARPAASAPAPGPTATPAIPSGPSSQRCASTAYAATPSASTSTGIAPAASEPSTRTSGARSANSASRTTAPSGVTCGTNDLVQCRHAGRRRTPSRPTRPARVPPPEPGPRPPERARRATPTRPPRSAGAGRDHMRASASAAECAITTRSTSAWRIAAIAPRASSSRPARSSSAAGCERPVRSSQSAASCIARAVSAGSGPASATLSSMPALVDGSSARMAASFSSSGMKGPTTVPMIGTMPDAPGSAVSRRARRGLPPAAGPGQRMSRARGSPTNRQSAARCRSCTECRRKCRPAGKPAARREPRARISESAVRWCSTCTAPPAAAQRGRAATGFRAPAVIRCSPPCWSSR